MSYEGEKRLQDDAALRRAPGDSAAAIEVAAYAPLRSGNLQAPLKVMSADIVPVGVTDRRFVDKRSWRGKRAFDVLGAALIGLVAAPVFLVILIMLCANSGRAFFGQRRVGQHGRFFTCYKFQTMVPNAEEVLHELLDADPDARAEWERDQKLRDDPRVTRVGKFLRRTSLDELPQLWNVLRGDMSLVGPRPIVQEEMIRYGTSLQEYLAVRPGLTGLWQVSGRNDTDYEERVILDHAYVLSSCFIFDLGIILRTVGVVLFRSRGC